ncbi:MAG TPA: hypothetical protein VN326_21435 [Casimicrobiaceae bacterium]|jgi:hypothetical protein|nr:hypothetical protein [Casimicrobiaceae bacterium]
MIAETHWPLALGLMLIAGFGSWVFIHSNRSYLLRWAIIPVSVIVAVLSARLYDVRLGYTVPFGDHSHQVLAGSEPGGTD